MTFFVLVVGLIVGVYVWYLQSWRISSLLDSFQYLNVNRFEFLYDVFTDADPKHIHGQLKGLVKRALSVKTHDRAAEKYKRIAYDIWRSYYYSELLKFFEILAIYLVLPALIYNSYIGVLLIGFILGCGVPATGRQLMGTGRADTICLLFRHLAMNAYTLYGIKFIAGEADPAVEQSQASQEVATVKNAKKLPASLKEIRAWRIFKWSWWAVDVMILVCILANSMFSIPYNDLPWYTDASSPLILWLMLQAVFFMPCFIIFRLYAIGSINRPKTASKWQKITTKLRNTINE